MYSLAKNKGRNRQEKKDGQIARQKVEGCLPSVKMGCIENVTCRQSTIALLLSCSLHVCFFFRLPYERLPADSRIADEATSSAADTPPGDSHVVVMVSTDMRFRYFAHLVHPSVRIMTGVGTLPVSMRVGPRAKPVPCPTCRHERRYFVAFCSCCTYVACLLSVVILRDNKKCQVAGKHKMILVRHVPTRE